MPAAICETDPRGDVTENAQQQHHKWSHVSRRANREVFIHRVAVKLQGHSNLWSREESLCCGTTWSALLSQSKIGEDLSRYSNEI